MRRRAKSTFVSISHVEDEWVVRSQEGEAHIVEMDEEWVDVYVIVGDMELDIRGDDDHINSWIVHDVAVWIDRRAAWDYEDVNLPVAKLQAHPEVAPLLEEVKKVWIANR